jgi:hypothetical protein
LSIPYISLVVLSELLFDDDGVDIDSGRVNSKIPIHSIKIAKEKCSKDSIHF